MGLDNYKEKSPYHGIWAVCIMLIVVPIMIYLIVHGVIFKYQTHFSYQLNLATSKAFGCGVGFLFHLSCIFAGLLTEPLHAIFSRVREFFSNVGISLKLALTCYWHDIVDGGVVFWIYSFIIAANLHFCVTGILDFLEIYAAMPK